MNKIIRNLGIFLATFAASGSVGAAPIVGYSPGAYGSFYSVDLASGTRTLMGSGTGLSFQDFEYAPDGTLVGYSSGAYGSFYSVDLVSGTRTLMGSGTGLSFQGFEYAPDGTLVGYSPGAYGSFYSVDLASGTRTLMGSGTGLSFQDFEYAPLRIPEPSTISLILVTLAGLRIARYRISA